MKVLHIISGLGNGGAEKVLYKLSVSDRGNKHYVVSLMNEGVYGESLKKNGIPVYCLNMKRGSISFKGVVEMFSILRKIKPDTVQTWMYHADLIGGILAKLAGCKDIVWGIRGPYNKDITSLSTKAVIYTCAVLSRFIPNSIASNSIYAIEAHVKCGYDRKKFKYIPNGYDIGMYKPSSATVKKIRKEFGLHKNSVLLGMVARFDPYKDHENLLRALHILSKQRKGFVCVLVGTGMDKANTVLIEMIEKYSLKGIVKLVGARYDIPHIMEALDLHVLSSVAESFPNVIAEAMMCETVCVTTDAGDASNIVDETGWVVPASDPKALANAISSAMGEMEDASLWGERGHKCRARIADNFSLNKMIESYLSIWS